MGTAHWCERRCVGIEIDSVSWTFALAGAEISYFCEGGPIGVDSETAYWHLPQFQCCPPAYRDDRFSVNLMLAMSGFSGPSGSGYSQPSATSGMAWVPMSIPGAVFTPPPVPYDTTMDPWTGAAPSVAKPAWDMDTLKAAIHYARAGTGEVRSAIETCTFRPREAAFTALINLCGRLRDAAKAFEVFEAMKGYKGVRPNTYTYSSLISACSSSGDWGKAMEVFRVMKDAAATDPGCKPNEVTYSALITACERAGKFTEALELYDEMLQAGIAADKVTFCSALAACEKSERWERAEQIVEDMHGRGMSGTTSIYFELLRHYARQADWNKGLDLFLTMQMMGHEVDKHCCRALMQAFETSGRYVMALQLLQTMENEIEADLPTYNLALWALARAGRWNDAVTVVDQIYKSGLQPDSETVRAAVRACLVGGRKDEAVKLIDKFEASGVAVEDELKAAAQ